MRSGGGRETDSVCHGMHSAECRATNSANGAIYPHTEVG